jgi:hypothetical protein
MELIKIWDNFLIATWGRLAFRWYQRAAKKKYRYGDCCFIPPGYEFKGWVHKKPGSSGTYDPLTEQVSTVGYVLCPSDSDVEHGIKVV